MGWCMCTCVCTCTCMSTCICMCTCTCTCVYVYVNVYMYMYVYMYLYRYVYMYMYFYVFVCACIFVSTCTCMYMCIFNILTTLKRIIQKKNFQPQYLSSNEKQLMARTTWKFRGNAKHFPWRQVNSRVPSLFCLHAIRSRMAGIFVTFKTEKARSFVYRNKPSWQTKLMKNSIVIIFECENISNLRTQCQSKTQMVLSECRKLSGNKLLPK